MLLLCVIFCVLNWHFSPNAHMAFKAELLLYRILVYICVSPKEHIPMWITSLTGQHASKQHNRDVYVCDEQSRMNERRKSKII